MRLAELPQSLLDQRRIGQDPAVERAVVDLHTAFEKQLFAIAVAERVAQVPGDRLHDQRRLEMAALEVVFGPALQLGRDGVEDHGHL